MILLAIKHSNLRQEKRRQRKITSIKKEQELTLHPRPKQNSSEQTTWLEQTTSTKISATIITGGKTSINEDY